MKHRTIQLNEGSEKSNNKIVTSKRPHAQPAPQKKIKNNEE